MRKRHLSLSVKLNILIVVIVLTLSSLLLAISDNTYHKTVYDPYIRRLSGITLDETIVSDWMGEIIPCLGTEEMKDARAGDDELSLLSYMAGVKFPPKDGVTDRTLASELMTLSLYLFSVSEDGELDEICVEARKGENIYRVFRQLRGDDPSENLVESFGKEITRFPDLKPGDYSKPVLVKDAGTEKLIRQVPIETEAGTGTVWMAYEMGDFFANHRSFLRQSILLVLLMTVLASAAGMFLMRRLVTRRVRNLSKAARDFAPGEDGKYAMESVSRAETGTEDEIGDLGREIRNMQERIVGNTESLARMTAEKQRIATELDLAATIQAAVLPKGFPAFPERPEFDLYASMTPAREVGGDFYDFFLVDEDHLALVIADVSGKGVPAALFMMITKALIKDQLMTGCDPATAMGQVNRMLCEGNDSKMFVTVWLAVVELSTGRGTACNAGHEKPAVRRGDGPFELLEYRHDWIAGALGEAKYHSRSFELHPGDCLFVYTDGVTEAADPDEAMFREEQLVRTLNTEPAAAPEEQVRRMQDAVNAFARGAQQSDDITMLCLEYRGPDHCTAGQKS